MATALPTTLGALRKSANSPPNASPAASRTSSAKTSSPGSAPQRRPEDTRSSPASSATKTPSSRRSSTPSSARHNFILLGLRGQAKSRILRALTTLLDPACPYVAGSEIRDNPYAPISKFAATSSRRLGDETPIAWLTPNDRFVEKLATPDVTVADLVGDIDPIKAARSNQDLGSELTMHYGLLPRANRGIFAINELPDLAGKIQVALFNIMQEGDVQIKGYPVRLPLDVAIVFSANPEDYTARGKIVTPLKDRIGSEIRTHYPEDIEEGITITAQEAWSQRACLATSRSPTTSARSSSRSPSPPAKTKRSTSAAASRQRLPISTMELVVSNAERRALLHDETLVVPRVGDIYAALPGISGKIELEYEGEMRGADTVIREIIRASVASVFDQYFADTNTQQIEQWFNLGGTVQLNDAQPAAGSLAELQQIQGLFEKLSPLEINGKIQTRSSPSAPPSSCSKACTPTSASAAPKSASSPPPKRNPAPTRPSTTPKKCANREQERLRRPKTAPAAASTKTPRHHGDRALLLCLPSHATLRSARSHPWQRLVYCFASRQRRCANLSARARPQSHRRNRSSERNRLHSPLARGQAAVSPLNSSRRHPRP